MSHRMCADCKTVINNRITNSIKCPDCGSLNMADPNEFNNEWAMLYKAQCKLLEQEFKISQLEKCLEFHEGHMTQTCAETSIAQQTRDLQQKFEKTLEALKNYARGKTTIRVGCDGKHSMYSSMMNDDICPKCGISEDTIGGDIRKTIDDPTGDTARECLTELGEKW